VKSYNPSRLPPLRKRMNKRNLYIRTIEQEISKTMALMIEKGITYVDLDTLEMK